MPNKLNEERLKDILADLTLLDDIMMSQVFDNNIPAASLLLKVILRKNDIKVISVVGQKVLKSNEIGGRSIKLDILAEDSEGKSYNVEIQRSKDGADEHRARFHKLLCLCVRTSPRVPLQDEGRYRISALQSLQRIP